MISHDFWWFVFQFVCKIITWLYYEWLWVYIVSWICPRRSLFGLLETQNLILFLRWERESLANPLMVSNTSQFDGIFINHWLRPEERGFLGKSFDSRKMSKQKGIFNDKTNQIQVSECWERDVALFWRWWHQERGKSAQDKRTFGCSNAMPMEHSKIWEVFT